MTPQIVTFDTEIAEVLDPGVTDLQAHFPLGISCAALCVDGATEFFHAEPRLSPTECQALVDRIYSYVQDGVTVVTWNGCSFDFHLLAAETGDYDKCAHIARNHCDLMLCVTFQKGYFLGLDKALKGAGLAGKQHTVTLNSGEVITEMAGALAPQYWAAGEVDAVLAYLRGDVEALYELVRWVQRRKKLTWTSNTGREQAVPMPKLYTVKELFKLPKPDTSWMSNAPTRESFVAWTKGKG